MNLCVAVSSRSFIDIIHRFRDIDVTISNREPRNVLKEKEKKRPMDQFIYILPCSISRKKLHKNLPNRDHYQISIEKGEKREGLLLDTFEDELFSANKLLFQVENVAILLDLQTGRVIEQTVPQKWSFAEELDEGPVASQVRGVSKLRAFLPITKVKLRRENGFLLDDEIKTRARFHNLEIYSGKKTLGVGSTIYLRGYGKAHTDLQQLLVSIGASSCRDTAQIYGLLGIKRETYNAKPHIPLNPNAPAKESATKIIQSHIRVARRNEDGVVADYDTEFLHDYRVSFRKVRSVLSLFKGVYSPEETARLKSEFAEIMQKTNLLRDLDVYLLNRKEYLSLVPEDTHGGLEILFDHFAALRTKEYVAVSKEICSKSYLRRVDTLGETFAESSMLTSGPKGEVNSLTFACRLVLKRYGQVCKIARSIDKKTEDAVVHQLRINCKKLRYLMEFFSPLFPKDEIKNLIKALKLLQDNLGRFNDYSVQQSFLRQLLKSDMNDFGRRSLIVAESIGALTAMLHRLQKKERGLVMKNFAHFDSSETRAAFTELFQKK